MHKWKIAAVLLAIVAILGAFPVAALEISPSDIDYVIDEDGEKVYIPKTYELEQIIGDFGSNLNNPKDLFIDAQDHLYIADTGNNRVVELDESYQFVRELYGDGTSNFQEPTGVFVSHENKLYVADYGNSRVSVMNADGTHIRDYVKPQSELLGDLFEFRPSKVCVNEMNDVYLIMGKNFMMLDEDNQFKGYIGAEDVAFSFTDFIVRLFATEAQKEKLARAEPPAYNNFSLGPNGRIYAVSLGSTNQIKIINSVGNNIYPVGQAYGEQSPGATGSWVIPSMLNPNFVDVAVDENGIITAIDQINCRIYQYDPDGNLLTVFGGIGSVGGFFGVPTALAIDSAGKLYVLDSTTNQIHVFRPTEFIQTIHNAIGFYNDGRYEEAKALWQEIASLNTGYPLAEQSLGDIYFKEKDYTAAMAHYRTIGNREDYTEAYGKWLHDRIAGSFLFVAFGLIALVLLLLFGLGRFKKVADRWRDELFGIPTERPVRRRRRFLKR